jgi:cytosine/adenosine deaminase-related metal-dependent hydrolase
MTFAGINYLAIVVAAIAGWLGGAVYYGMLANPWVAAHGKTMEQFKAENAAKKGTPAGYAPFIVAFVADLVMAWVLAGMVGHLGTVTIRSAVISGLFAWAGFIATTIAVNYAFGGRRIMLTVIDAGHWLLVVVLMGIVIGWMGI